MKKLLSMGAVWAYLCMALYPVAAFIGYMSGYAAYALPFVYMAGMALLGMFIGIVRGTKRLFLGGLAFIPMLIGFICLFPVGLFHIPLSALAAVLYFVVLMRAPMGLVYGYNPAMMLSGVIASACAFILSYLSGEKDFAETLAWPSAFFLIASILMMNRVNLHDVVLRRNKNTPKALTQGNIALTGLFAAVLLIITNIRAISDFVGGIANAVVQAVVAFVLWISSIFNTSTSQEEVPADDGGMGMLPPVEDVETSLFSVIINYIFYALSIILVVVLAVLLCWTLYKLAKKLIVRLRAMWGVFRGGFQTGYVDESDSLFDGENILANMADGVKGFIRRVTRREPRWDALTDTERVRYVYLRRKRLITKDGVSAAEYLTPDQMLGKGHLSGSGDAAAFAEAYNAVRYGERDAAPAQAENARRLLP